MSLGLRTKKNILIITLITLISGYFLQLLPDEVKPEVLYTSTISNAVYAASGYEPTVTVPQGYTISFSQNEKSINTKMKDISINKEQVRKIQEYLSRRGAPLAAEARTFVEIADKYGLPYNLMPAISVIESGGGLHNYRPYNYAGMGGQSNAYVFSSYEQAIETHASIIKKGYFDKGAVTPELMEPYYCYQCPTWGEKVQGVMNAIDAE